MRKVNQKNQTNERKSLRKIVGPGKKTIKIKNEDAFKNKEKKIIG